MTQYRRADAFPMPTVEAIETALDTLITAIVKHETKRYAALRPEGEMFTIYDATDLLNTEFLPGEELINDPVGKAMRLGLTKLGKCLFALTNSTATMQDVCERVAARRKPNALRGGIIDKWWDGIGNEHSRWSA